MRRYGWKDLMGEKQSLTGASQDEIISGIAPGGNFLNIRLSLSKEIKLNKKSCV
ncbi:hypothetical protein [Okeania sp. SIO1I7]|uniref:hypothetical protein n=1 Tax=Okeania sp. SIO1I7 TaxID=2607772 RepID=UPI0013F8AAF5|nr:hypothetical protein [Okeania sp. SIO1I7]NET25944.1 hypothetical protein [Okeania sp. SIO1I7]